MRLFSICVWVGVQLVLICGQPKTPVCVENLLRETGEPFLEQASAVDPLFFLPESRELNCLKSVLVHERSSSNSLVQKHNLNASLQRRTEFVELSERVRAEMRSTDCGRVT